eukprot:TRINITY_DN8934_c0_g1_i1.p1 TRINITY_DN8934_c0_g1~~TRINITY_DN8934_c0_g1_i1.p1  ORF type:complete len:332 (+),score=62.52 TRINITY_DN8934_c0_g1_i1:55-1050(+)
MGFSQDESQQMAIVYLSSVVVGLLVVLSRDRPRTFQIVTVFIVSSLVTGLLTLWIVPREDSRCRLPPEPRPPPESPGAPAVAPAPSVANVPPPDAPAPLPAPSDANVAPPDAPAPLPAPSDAGVVAAPPPDVAAAAAAVDAPPSVSINISGTTISIDDMRTSGFCPVGDLSIKPGVDPHGEMIVGSWHEAAIFTRSVGASAFSWLPNNGKVYPKTAPLRLRNATVSGVAVAGVEGSLMASGLRVYCVMAGVGIAGAKGDPDPSSASSIKEAVRQARKAGADGFVFDADKRKVTFKTKPFSFQTPDSAGFVHAGILVSDGIAGVNQAIARRR